MKNTQIKKLIEQSTHYRANPYPREINAQSRFFADLLQSLDGCIYEANCEISHNVRIWWDYEKGQNTLIEGSETFARVNIDYLTESGSGKMGFYLHSTWFACLELLGLSAEPAEKTTGELVETLIFETQDVKHIAAAIPFCGKYENRPAFSGVFIGKKSDWDYIAALDGYALYFAPGTFSAENEYILPIDLCKAMAAKKQAFSVDFLKTESGYLAELDGVQYELINEKFPDFLNVVPTGSTLTAEVNTKQLADTLKLVHKSANKVTNGVKFMFEKELARMAKPDGLVVQANPLHLMAEDSDMEKEANVTIPAEITGQVVPVGQIYPPAPEKVVNTSDFLIQFDAKLILKALKAQKSAEVVELNFTEPYKAGLITSKDSDAVCLVMPQKLN